MLKRKLEPVIIGYVHGVGSACLVQQEALHQHKRQRRIIIYVCRYRMPSTQQFAYFFAFIGAGLVFMILAFSVFLPVIALAPSKFALSFTIGSLLVMAGFAALRGLKQQASHMLSASRLPFTAGMCICAEFGLVWSV